MTGTRILWGLLVLLLGACAGNPDGYDTRLSGVVGFAEDVRFLADPGTGYVEAYVRFGADLPADVIVFVDQELLEGVTNYRWTKGGDWMAFVGFQRDGTVWVGGGSDAALAGTPSHERNWKLFELGQALLSDTWYRVRVTADFASRRFLGFEIEGGGLARRLDLSGIPLDYPNYIPFDRGSMIYLVGAVRARKWATQSGRPLVFFDDVVGAVRDGDRYRTVFANDFEKQTTVGPQPVTLPVVKLDNYAMGWWYQENEASLFRIERRPFARSGAAVGVADATLAK
ncbi:hypothetical protein [Oceanithermus desulfurans]